MKIKKNSEKINQVFGQCDIREIADNVLSRIDGEEDYEDSYEAINDAMDCELIYTDDIWAIIKYYCTPTTADYEKAICDFATELWECVDEI